MTILSEQGPATKATQENIAEVPIIVSPCCFIMDGHRYSIDERGLWLEADDGLSWSKVDPNDLI